MSDEKTKIGFGTFTGVFVPNITMMFGVILFMRLSLVVGSVGIWEFLGIIGISLVLMTITSYSVAALATNTEVGNGGVYYLISRALGIEIGGAFGIALVLSQLICCAMCATGFAYSINALYPNISTETIEVLTLVGLTLISLCSADLALKLQTVIFVALVISIASIFFSDTSYVGSTVAYLDHPMSFWEGFAIFYPAVTGIEAGMAMSGNLKNPARSLSIGNILSVGFSGLVYTGLALFLWTSYSSTALMANPLLILDQAKIPSLIYVGIWCATLSSALGALLAAPRMLQMIAQDGIAPTIFSRTYGRYQDPRWGVAAIFIVATILVLYTTIDQILPILTMICLLTYGILNLVAGLCDLIHSPSWRPTIRSPWQVSLLGAAMAVVLMLMIDPAWTIAAIASLGCIYLFLKRRSVESRFLDFRTHIVFFFSRLALYWLSQSKEHSLNWFPQVIAFSRAPSQPKKMIRLASSITRRSGLLAVVSIAPETWGSPEQLDRAQHHLQGWVNQQAVRGLIDTKAYADYHEGMIHLIKSYGMGPFNPNTLMIPASENFEADLDGLVAVATAAQQNQKNLLLFFDAPQSPLSLFTRPHYRRKVIDLWWNQEHRESFELMLSLIMSMRTSMVWKHREVNLRALASDEKAQGYLQEHFTTMLTKMRVKAKAKVVTEHPDSTKTHFQHYSERADLLFVPLRPITEFEAPGLYSSYLKEFAISLPRNIPAVAVTCYDAVDHREVYL